MKTYYFYEFGYIEVSKEESKAVGYSKILNGITGEILETDCPERYLYVDGDVKELDFATLSVRGLATKKDEENEFEARIQAKIRQQAIDAIKAEEAAAAK